MIILSETTDILQAVLAAAVATSELEFFVSFRDITATAYTPGRGVIASNGTTDVDIAGAPAASTKRVIDLINIYNKDTAPALVTIKLDANGTEFILWKDYLDPDQTLTYVDGAGWSLSGGFRPIKQIVIHGDAGANFAMTNATQAERFALGATRFITEIDLAGYSQVRMKCNVQVGSASVNTPKFRAKYYTSYNATVGNFLTLGSAGEVEISVVAVGYQNTGWVSLVAGAKIDGCCIGFTEIGGDGVADPALGHSVIEFR